MPSPCLQCGTRGVCPQCRARKAAAVEYLSSRPSIHPALVPERAATRSAVLSDHRGAEPTLPTDPESSAVSAPAALERAVSLTAEIAVLEEQLRVKRQARAEACRQSTTGPDALPVSQVAKRLGLSRERLYKILG